MSLSNLVNQYLNIGRDIKTYEFGLIEEVGGNIDYAKTSKLIRHARRLAILTRMIPNPLLHDCLQRLETDIDIKDWEAVSKHHGYALAAVDLIEYISEQKESVQELGTGLALTPRSEEALVTIRTSLFSLGERLHRLESAVNHLSDNKQFPVPLAESKTEGDVDLHPKERITLYTMLLGMALEQYAYNPNAARGNAATHIASDLLQHGLKLSEDNIREKLRTAWSLVGDKVACTA
jgi:hypothetical protein